jgi:beta-glucanase (GH16 family)
MNFRHFARRTFVLAVVWAGFSTSPTATRLSAREPGREGWKLIWRDEFDQKRLDATKWTSCERGTADWDDTMSRDPRCIEVKGGVLKLNGFVNTDTKNDRAPFLTGGVKSQGKFEFHHGKLEVRARFKSAQGAWPSIWLLAPGDRWPEGGEIDIMEHLNFDDLVYQTLHTPYTENSKPKRTDNYVTARINRKDFNTYGVEWDSDKVRFFVNGVATFAYHRIPNKGPSQWPFKRPLFIILSMQIGGEWVGPARPAHYPAHMEVDWIRVYRRSSL